tara:strand:- start:364 stop:540 length:177 start_codon:yes stop_codon:yes gene_type:complete
MVEKGYIPKFTTGVGEGISTSDKTLRREITKLSETYNKIIELYEKRIRALEKRLAEYD